ncbi:MAG TPA: DUF72 domain-containing protein [Gaiella sp.]|nr:DUF72 domain-containing protein [Gaiella sp.]
MIRVGTCSWADESFSKAWYPKSVKSGERLGYYAGRFDVVEANSTFYRLPDEDLVARWARLLPDGFVMHVKAFGLMTRHPVRLDALPEDLRDAVEVDERGRVDRPSREVRGEVFRRFLAALEPLREAGRLGGILMQFPPYVVPKPRSYEYLEWSREQLADYEMLVEFRHKAWFEAPAEPLAFLEQQGMTYVTVDAPPDVIPLVVGRTSGTAYVRFHGRNRATWFKRTGSTAERFDYLYSPAELREWAKALRELDAETEVVYAMFNNNGRSAGGEVPRDLAEGRVEVAQAPTNAAMLKQLLA